MELDPATLADFRRRRAWLRRAALLLVELVILGVLAAACGGSPSASASGGSGQSSYGQAVAFARCMRSHGVSTFPDPNSQGQFALLGSGIDPSSARFQSAQKACQHLDRHSHIQSPTQHEHQVQQTLKYVACMRSHGIANFPEPPPSGQMTINPGSLGIDTNSPTFQRAQQACRSYLPGGGSGSGSSGRSS